MKKTTKKIVCAVLIALVTCTLLAGCSQAERASYNISKEADRFNVTRRLAVINARTDKPVFELVGNFSLSNNTTNELEITCEVGEGIYKKHFVYLNDWTIYSVEDVSGAYVDPYHYEVNYMPEMLVPVTFTARD